MFSGARTSNKNNEILRKNMRRKYKIWDLKQKYGYKKGSLKNAKKRDKDNLDFIQSENFNAEFENARLRRLLIGLALIILLLGVFVLKIYSM